jgi:hypothetical protein
MTKTLQSPARPHFVLLQRVPAAEKPAAAGHGIGAAMCCR